MNASAGWRPRLPFSPWHLLIAPVALLYVLPLLWLVLTSLMPEVEINRFPPTIIPSSLTLDNYQYVIQTAHFPRWFANSMIVSLTVVASNLVFCSLAGYAFARMRFRGSKLVLALMVITVTVPIQLTMIPLFLLMKKLGLVDTLFAAMAPNLVLGFGVFLLRQFFLSIPRELEEAAWIDGCSRLKILWEIVLPLAKPALAAVAVISFLWTWNELTWPLVVLNDESNYTLQLGLASFQGARRTLWGAVMAGNVITVLPVIVAFLAAQKTFTRSLASSAVKG